MERTRFIVVGMQRSGTTVTHVGLKDHPSITMSTDEVYISPFFTKGLSAFTGGKESYAQRRSGFLALFDLLAASRVTEKTEAFGIKCAVGNRQEAIEFCNAVREYFPDIRIILISREDLVSQHASLLRAEKSGEWHAWEGQKRAWSGSFAIPRQAFLDYATECRHTVAQLRTLKRSHKVMELVYERDIAPGVRYDLVFEFLGVPVIPVDWLKMSKVAPPAETFVDNFADLKNLMADLPVPSESEEAAAARAVWRDRSKAEMPNFLMSRACDAFDRGQLEDGWADVEAGLAVSAGRPLDASMRAKAAGVAERAVMKSNAVMRDDLMAALERDVAGNPFFILTRAEVRARSPMVATACNDTLGVLNGSDALDEKTRKKALDVLAFALERRGEASYAVETMEALGPRYGKSGQYQFLLCQVYARVGRLQDAIKAVQAALELEPQHAAARDLLAKWQGSK